MKKIGLFLLALGAGIYLIYQQQQPISAPVNQTNTTPATSDTNSNTPAKTSPQLILTATGSGQTALELLSVNAQIKTKDYGEAGLFVTSIDGVESDNEHYWAFYVNDEYAQQGVSQTILKSGDTIKFVYEEITL